MSKLAPAIKLLHMQQQTVDVAGAHGRVDAVCALADGRYHGRHFENMMSYEEQSCQVSSQPDLKQQSLELV